MKNKKIVVSLISVGALAVLVAATPLVSGLIAKRVLYRFADQINNTYNQKRVSIDKYQFGYLHSNALVSLTLPTQRKISIPINITSGPFSKFRQKTIFGIVAKGQLPIPALKTKPDFQVALPYLNKRFSALIMTQNLNVKSASQAFISGKTTLEILGQLNEDQKIKSVNLNFRINTPSLQNFGNDKKIKMDDFLFKVKLDRVGEKNYAIYPSIAADKIEYQQESENTLTKILYFHLKGLLFQSKRIKAIVPKLQTAGNFYFLLPELKKMLLSNVHLEVDGIDINKNNSDELKIGTIKIGNKRTKQGFEVLGKIEQVALKSKSKKDPFDASLEGISLHYLGEKLKNNTWDYFPTLRFQHLKITAPSKLNVTLEKFVLGPIRLNSALTKKLYAKKPTCAADTVSGLLSECEIRQKLERLKDGLMYQAYATLPSTRFDVEKLAIEAPLGGVNATIQQSFKGLSQNPTSLDVTFARKQKIRITSPTIRIPIGIDSTLVAKKLSMTSELNKLNGDTVLTIPEYTQTGQYPFQILNLIFSLKNKANADFSDTAFTANLRLAELNSGANKIANTVNTTLGFDHINLKALNDVLLKLNKVAKPNEKKLTRQQQMDILLAGAKDFLRGKPGLNFDFVGNLFGAPVKATAQLVLPFSAAESAKNKADFLSALRQTTVQINAEISSKLATELLNNINPIGSYGYPHPTLPATQYLTQLQQQGIIKEVKNGLALDLSLGIDKVAANGTELTSLQKVELFLQLGFYRDAFLKLEKLLVKQKSNPQAIYYFGVLNYHGLGTERSQVLGEMLIQKAASLGCVQAKAYLKNKAKTDS